MRPPPAHTVERWAWDLVVTTDLEAKLSPPVAPDEWESDPPVRRLAAPGRPAALEVTDRSPKTPRPGALADPDARARLCHTFLHHELQAAELFAWALLAFPDAPRAFRAGLVAIAREELVHAGLYRAHVAKLGRAFGDFPVRDWFWERVPSCATPAEFCALLGMGFEGANLEHATTFAERFRAAGDEEGAAVQERVARDEVSHVRFAATWFERWTGGSFESWVDHLPEPLTPTVLRGRPLQRELRRRAGLSDRFLSSLEAWPDEPPGS